MQEFIIWIILAYFLGNISTSYFVGKIMGNIDIRNHGSGNAGATNALRVLGVKAGVITLIGDMLKGMIIVGLAKYFGNFQLALACGLAVIIGHDFPVLFHFKGGKGIATSIGVFTFIDPIVTILSVIIGLIIILKSKYVSLGSIVAMVLAPFIMILLKRPKQLIIYTFIISLLTIYQHRSNLKRLFNGTENKLVK
ncbi:glycerol-3-phosphate 1-O-acyltransferase PlsY [Garciella nitratireducens]|uniref:Glycerol-3-phosphate acyltransferase n=1 Tax=Garciella nitratireducens DSM 15102 TaxID=1121911 RepID=A0A1T4LIZ3_9FIRM|nr:glycerol-3-phosphate 1-O-acyltransferase PlsY [Garciella nitratireducens]SJZ54548.1 acyl-phosphate glycerol-3-phosphate acyltransferase [Garciella nitratireducens DSM 15102]